MNIDLRHLNLEDTDDSILCFSFSKKDALETNGTLNLIGDMIDHLFHMHCIETNYFERPKALREILEPLDYETVGIFVKSVDGDEPELYCFHHHKK
jgi:hypothetical protein